MSSIPVVLYERIPDEYELKDQYDCACYDCNAEFYFKPSLLMLHGYNHGYSICLKCRVELNLRIDLNHGIGISFPTQEFLLKDFLKDDKKDQQ